MEYEIVKMESRTFAGLTEVTNNTAKDMGAKIGALWTKLYSGMAERIENRTNGKSVGLYCDYKANGDYTVLTGCQIDSAKTEEARKAGFETRTVPAGSYAKFTFHGDIQKAVAEAWSKIWQLPLERTFTGDYEEYQEDTVNGTGTIIIYIAVK